MKSKRILGVLLTVIFVISCSKKSTVEPTSVSKIEGAVTFTGDWPEPPEEIRVVVGADFPIKSFDDLKKSVNLADNGVVNYSIELPKGEYKFVGVAWKAQGGDWSLASICGVHTFDANFQAPAPVVISGENVTVSDVNISVDRSRAKKWSGSKISGTVTLQGAWPDSFASAFIVSSGKDLISEPFDLLDLNMGTAVERGQTSADYVIATPSGANKTIGVLFLDQDGSLTQEMVYYSQNNGGLEVKEQNISNNSQLAGPNFSVKLGAVASAIQGTISFTGTWPAKAEEVRLITATTFPPAIEELIIGEQISPDASSHKYTFYLKPDSYKLIGVAWRAEGTSWDIMSICGAYFAGEDSLAPSEVVITDENEIVKNINILVNRSKARIVSETYISGNIQFSNAWPAGFSEARVVATTKFQVFPTILPTMLDLAFSDPIAPGTTETAYTIKAFPGTFAAIGVIFLKENQNLTINDILYSLDVGGLSVEPFEGVKDATSAGPDFVITF